MDADVVDALTDSATRLPALIARARSGCSREGSIVDKLLRGSYIVEPDFDELAYLEMVYNRAKYDLSFAGLTIAPTLDCNFRCTYCFQEKRSSYMSGWRTWTSG